MVETLVCYQPPFAFVHTGGYRQEIWTLLQRITKRWSSIMRVSHHCSYVRVLKSPLPIILCCHTLHSVPSLMNYSHRLMKKINPGSISRINKLKSPIAHLVRLPNSKAPVDKAHQLITKCGHGRVSYCSFVMADCYFSPQDNIQLFLNACRELGMKDSQLFDMMDLQSPKVTPKKPG